MSGLEQANKAITEVCEALKTSPAIGRAIDSFREFLLDKNQKYGNSIYEPVRVFTSASIDSLILVRLNDKATRLLKGESGGEDSFDDLLGYLILRKALPLYLTWGTKEGQDVLDALHCGGFERAPIPGHVVTQSLRDRGLRVGMTFEEVRDNKWTECESVTAEGPEPISGWCSESDPCSACKFLDGALCECGDSFVLHAPHGQCPKFDDSSFVLASWTPEPSEPTVVFLDNAQSIETVNSPSTPDTIFGLPVTDPSDGLTYREEPPVVYESVDADSQTAPIYKIGEVADVSEHKKETDMTDTNATTTTKKPRIDRKTWHESADGKHAIGSVLGFLSENPIVSWAIGKLTERSGLTRADVDLAIDHLLSTGAVVQHGKAKGTRYAVAGFKDWPAPVPRNRKTNEPPVSEADADAAHSLDASDNEET